MPHDAIMSVRLPAELADQLRAVAAQQCTKVSALLRDAVERLASPQHEARPVPAAPVTWLRGTITGTVPPPTSYTVSSAAGYVLWVVPDLPPDADGVLARRAA